MAISPWYVGMTGESFTIYCRTDGSGAMDLSNYTANNLTLMITPPNGSETPGGGLFQIINAEQGVVQYQPANSDVSVAQTCQIAVRITTGPNQYIYSDKTAWEILSR